MSVRLPPTPASGSGSVSTLLDAGLVADVRFVTDPRLLAALHAELRRRFDPVQARAVLLQAGFFHGLRDALRIGSERLDDRRSGATPPLCSASLVPLRLACAADAHGPALSGTWPRPREADAVRIACGTAPAPACAVTSGYTSGWLSGLWGADWLALERSCTAAGAATCSFEAREAAVWRTLDDPAARAALAALPFASLRDAVARELPAGLLADPGAFDPESSAVHVWGPVMIVPYAGEETATAVDAVVRDPDAAAVSVVVIDLDGAVVDDGFGAAALERVIDTIRAWGAEPVIAGVAPLSEPVVASLSGEPIIVPKDLSAAIAVAFQVAESQRRTS